MTRSPIRRPSLLLLVAALLWEAGCLDENQVAGLRDTTSVGRTDEPAASNPITAPLGATGRVAAGLSASVTAGQGVAYVYLPPGTVSDGGLATITNTRLNVDLVVPMQEGGFDPVGIAAAPGDVLQIAVQQTGGAVVSFTVTVPRTARPKVVRADPPPRKRDVPLNTHIVVVFSEPIKAGTEAGVTVRLAGARVSGRVLLSADGLRVEFQPSGLLAPNTTYEISISTAVTDLSGDALAQPVGTDFTTGTTQVVASVATDPAALIEGANGIQRTLAMSAVRDNRGSVSGRFSIFFPDIGWRVFGRITCFTIVNGKAAWVAGVVESSNDTAAIGRDLGWRAIDNGPAGGATIDGLSVAYALAAEGLGTAQAFCAQRPTTSPSSGELRALAVLSGDIIVSGSGPPPPPSGGVSEIAFANWPNGGIQVMSADGTAGRVLTSVEGDWSPAWSPDGSKLAFDRTVGFLYTGDIYVINADGSGLKGLTTDNFDDRDPSWSPDGSQIVFGRGGAIHVMNADGSGVRALTGGGYDFHPSWSPDGSRIAFASSRNGTNAIYVMASDGTGVRQITNSSVGDYSPWWSPDGGKIAFQRDEAVVGTVYLVNPDGTGLTKLTLFGRTPSWSPDSRVIVFEQYGLTLVNVDGSGMLRLGIGFDPAWSPIGTMPARPQPFVSLSIAGGDGQSGAAGTSLTEPLTVRATREDGSPVSGVHISWYLPDGGLPGQSYLSSYGSVTDAQGLASVSLTLGTSAPPQIKLRAAVTDGTGLTPGVEFTATVAP